MSRDPAIEPSLRRIRLPSAWAGEQHLPDAPERQVVAAAEQQHRDDREAETVNQFIQHDKSLLQRQVFGDRAEHRHRHEHQQTENDDHGPQRDPERRGVRRQRAGGFRAAGFAAARRRAPAAR